MISDGAFAVAARSLQAHQNINDVMLATALTPDMFLSIGELDVPDAP
jgi:hypothetical protein